MKDGLEAVLRKDGERWCQCACGRTLAPQPAHPSQDKPGLLAQPRFSPSTVANRGQAATTNVESTRPFELHRVTDVVLCSGPLASHRRVFSDTEMIAAL